jgi:hypothetical protein
MSWVLGLQNLQHAELCNCTAIMSFVEPQDDGEEQPPTFSSLMTLIMVNLTELRSICSPRVSFPWLGDYTLSRKPGCRRSVERWNGGMLWSGTLTAKLRNPSTGISSTHVLSRYGSLRWKLASPIRANLQSTVFV